jgi:hypothetical protein
MHRISLTLTLAAALGAAALGNAAAPARAAPSRSTTIAVTPASIQDGTSKRPARWHSGSRPKNPDNIVQSIGIAL